MVHYRTFAYDIKFDYDNGFDRKFKDIYITADSAEEYLAGVNEAIRKLFENGLVTSQNLRNIEAVPKTDADLEKATFGKVQYNLNQAKEKFKNFFSE